MYIRPTLDIGRRALIKGLETGQFHRFGGTIRRAAGTPGAGQIVALLREAGPLYNVSPDPFSIALKAVDVVTNVHGHYKTHTLVREGFALTQKMIRTNLAVSAVGATAGVMNLGLTAAGLYIMNKKLVRLQDDMNKLLRAAEDIGTTVEDVNKRLHGVEQRLVELKYFALTADIRLRDLLVAVHDVQQGLRAAQKGRVILALSVLADSDETEGGSRQQQIYAVSETRHALTAELSQRKLVPDGDPRRLMDTLDAYRLWTVCTLAEISAHRLNRNLEEAAETAESVSTIARSWSRQWTEDLFPQVEYSGVFRLGHSRFDKVVAEDTRRRLYYSALGMDLPQADFRVRELKASHQVAKDVTLSEQWFGRQAALANVLDMIEENTQRLESLSWEARFCCEEGLDHRRWEALPSPLGTDELEAEQDWRRD